MAFLLRKYSSRIVFSLAAVALSACSLFMPKEIVKAEERMQSEAQKIKDETPSHSRFSESEGHRIHAMEVSGEPTRPLIVFVHGSPGSWEGWAQYLNDPELRSKANMIAVDRPGFGESNPGTVEKSLEKQAALLASLIKRADRKQKVILVGHSFGGPVISRMAMDFPEKFSDLIILAGSIDPSLETTQWYQYPADWFVFSWMIPGDLVVCNREIMAVKPQLEQMLPFWSRITQGVTVIQGTADDLVPPGNADFAEKVLVNAKPLKIVRLPQMNHFIPWSKYELVKTEILATLARPLAVPE